MTTNFLTEESEKLLGKEFCNELNKILEIRAERKLIYQDSFLQENSQDLCVMVQGKLKRYLSSCVFDNKIDSLRDLVNYTIFLTIVLNKEVKDDERVARE